MLYGRESQSVILISPVALRPFLWWRGVFRGQEKREASLDSVSNHRACCFACSDHSYGYWSRQAQKQSEGRQNLIDVQPGKTAGAVKAKAVPQSKTSGQFSRVAGRCVFRRHFPSNGQDAPKEIGFSFDSLILKH